jgi:hydrogenase maturation protein HypF
LLDSCFQHWSKLKVLNLLKIDKSILACDPFCIDFGYGLSVLAFGAELKSSICLLNDGVIYLSKQGGGLTETDNYRQFLQTAKIFQAALGKVSDVVAYDLHPEYASSRYALSLGIKSFPVQHHHAHIAACMVENGITEPVIGIAADGTGYGTDGAIWGCEVFHGDLKSFHRAGHLRYFKLFGGDAASIETWRPAAGIMSEIYGTDFRLDGVDDETLNIAKSRLTKGAGLARTSSLGRLFDGVSFLLGLCDKNTTEAQAAIALESSAAKIEHVEPLDYNLTQAEDGCIELDYRPMIVNLLEKKNKGINTDMLARQFHETIAVMLAESVDRVSQNTGIKKIMLSGGCFLNKILRLRISELTSANGLEVYTHKITSPGDGCVALGQAVICASNLMKG